MITEAERRFPRVEARGGLRRAAVCLAAWIFCLNAAYGQKTPQSSDLCAERDAEPVEVAALNENFEAVLSDGRILAFAGLDAPNGRAAAHFLRERAQRGELRAQLLTPAPDRWGRYPALIFARAMEAQEADFSNLSLALLEKGLARYRPDPNVHPCRAQFLKAESVARSRGAGLWSAQETPILRAAETQTLIDAPLGLGVVEGSIISFGRAEGRIYLNMGPVRGRDLALVISKRKRDLFDAANAQGEKLIGSRLRARGLLDRTFGLQMEISDADALEWLDSPPLSSNASGRGPSEAREDSPIRE